MSVSAVWVWLSSHLIPIWDWLIKLLPSSGTVSGNKSVTKNGENNTVEQNYKDSHAQTQRDSHDKTIIRGNISNTYNINIYKSDKNIPPNKINDDESADAPRPVDKRNLNPPLKNNEIAKSVGLRQSHKEDKTSFPETQKNLDFLRKTIKKS